MAYYSEAVEKNTQYRNDCKCSLEAFVGLHGGSGTPEIVSSTIITPAIITTWCAA